MKTTLSQIALFLSLVAVSFTTLPAAGHTDDATKSSLSVQFTHRSQLNAGDAITAHLTASADMAAQATVTDLKGHTIWKKDLKVAAGSNSLRFLLGELQSGVYQLNIVTPEGTQTRMFSIR
jgi:hypothetical protein